MYIIPQRAKKSTNKIINFDKKFTVSGVISIYLAYTIKNEVSNSRIHERVENAKLQALHEVKINEIYRSVYIPGGIVCGPCYICKLHHIDLEFIKVRVYNFKCIEKN